MLGSYVLVDIPAAEKEFSIRKHVVKRVHQGQLPVSDKGGWNDPKLLQNARHKLHCSQVILFCLGCHEAVCKRELVRCGGHAYNVHQWQPKPVGLVS